MAFSELTKLQPRVKYDYFMKEPAGSEYHSPLSDTIAATILGTSETNYFDLRCFYGKLWPMKNLDETILHIMTDRLVTEFDPDKIFLFGSHAWGTPGEDSDVDLYVIIPESNERPLRRARRAIACLGGMRIPKDILVRTRLEAEKYRNVHASLESMIFEKGRVLYERR